MQAYLVVLVLAELLHALVISWRPGGQVYRCWLGILTCLRLYQGQLDSFDSSAQGFPSSSRSAYAYLHGGVGTQESEWKSTKCFRPRLKISTVSLLPHFKARHQRDKINVISWWEELQSHSKGRDKGLQLYWQIVCHKWFVCSPICREGAGNEVLLVMSYCLQPTNDQSLWEWITSEWRAFWKLYVQNQGAEFVKQRTQSWKFSFLPLQEIPKFRGEIHRGQVSLHWSLTNFKQVTETSIW